jgi:acetolactate synthase-1/2/3 large subunit
MWNPNNDKTIVHIDALPAEVDANYIVAVGVLGDIGHSLRGITLKCKPRKDIGFRDVRKSIVEDRREYANDTAFPVKPQKIVWDVREVLGPEDIAISDVGAHKMWMSRMYRAERPNTCIISNGFAAMGIAVPGAIAGQARVSRQESDRRDGRCGLHDEFAGDRDGDAHEDADRDPHLERFGVRPHHLAPAAPLRPPGLHRLQEPDFVKYAESFGAKGYRVTKTEDLVPTLKKAFDDNTVVIVDCPVDYRENMKLTERLKKIGEGKR